MNGSGTVSESGTELTQAGSRPVRELPYEKRAREMIEFAGLTIPPPLDVRRPRGAAITRNREAQEAQTHEVYFLYCAGRVKIGTSNHALRRVMIEITPYCPVPHIILGTIPGGPIAEARLHDRFAYSRDHAEWFHLDPDLRPFLCEDQRRAERLDAAEGRYHEWLLAELARFQNRNTDENLRPDEGRGDRELDSDARPPG